MTINEMWFVKEKGKDDVFIARQIGRFLFRDNFKPEKSELEKVERVPHAVVYACVHGVKILNMARAMGFERGRE